MKMSMHMLGISLTRKKSRVLMQVGGTVISQNPCIGLHMKIETKKNARPQAITNALVKLTTIANARSLKIGKGAESKALPQRV